MLAQRPSADGGAGRVPGIVQHCLKKAYHMSGIRVVTGIAVGLALAVWCPALALASDEHPAPAPEHSDEAGHSDETGHSDEDAGDSSNGVAHGDAHGDAHGGGGGGPLTWQTDLAIWTGVVFVVLMLVLWKFAWGPIAGGLAKREQRIADEISSAQKSNSDARQLLEEYEQRLAASGQEVQEMIQAARQDGERVGNQIVEKAKAEAEVERKRAVGEIELATTNALKELAEQSATLAVGLAGRIVKSELDPKAHSQLIAQAMTDFSQKQPAGNGGPSGG